MQHDEFDGAQDRVRCSPLSVFCLEAPPQRGRVVFAGTDQRKETCLDEGQRRNEQLQREWETHIAKRGTATALTEQRTINVQHKHRVTDAQHRCKCEHLKASRTSRWWYPAPNRNLALYGRRISGVFVKVHEVEASKVDHVGGLEDEAGARRSTQLRSPPP